MEREALPRRRDDSCLLLPVEQNLKEAPKNMYTRCPRPIPAPYAGRIRADESREVCHVER